MPRGRVITPEFWTDGNMIGLSSWARLFYIGLWNHAYCDKGHLPDDPMGLKLKILPADDVDPSVLLSELEGAGRVVRLVSDGKFFLFMPSFEDHQKVDARWKTRCPACARKDSLKLTETQVSLGVLSETRPSSALRGEESNREKRRELDPAPVVLESLFDSAWVFWPKKVERKSAAAKFKAAAKKRDPETLVADIRRFGSAYAQTTEKQFVPALGVWLRGERWTDELPQVRGVSSVQSPADTRMGCGDGNHRFEDGDYCLLCARPREQGNPF